MTTPAPQSLLELHQIVKAYPGCLANDHIDLTLMPGEIHALLGENGAGKSTLVKIIYGVLQADEGQMLWEGNPVHIDSPATARALGIAMVFQHFSLFDSLTVQENIALGQSASQSTGGSTRPGADLGNDIREISARYGLPLDPDRYVYTLSVGERQRIEIVRCLLQEPRLLIMDEPTSVLTPQEVETLFATLETLAGEGVAILYISHKLEEILLLCNRASILRGGKFIGEADPAQESAQSLATMMIGEEVPPRTQSADTGFGATRLSLNDLSLPADDSFAVALDRVNLSVRSGEILGMAGVAGNGQDELLMAISGEKPLHGVGMITLRDQDITTLRPGARRAAGLCCVPEERLGHAAVPGMSLSENAFLTGHHRLPLQQSGFVLRRQCDEFAETVVEKFQVQCRHTGSLANSLSGGNLQKFIVGREILQNPDVLVVAQPTWGVDAGAAAAIHAALRQLAEQGAAIVLISQDLDELMAVSHSLMAICAGRTSAIVAATDVTVQQMGLLMGGMSLADDNLVPDGAPR